ncbi:MAG: acetyl-CoA carboxylase biotin carboxyl carrier protein [Pyrinomonadaceae bacterium]|nr:acetyl-CoA carboxylase biotin carboxyl carrier protein [Pyrinomonadaceae bacterium]
MDELRELVELIAAHGFTDFELEREGFRVRLRRELASSAPLTQMNDASSVSQTPAPVASSASPVGQSSVASSPSQTSPSSSGESQKTESKLATDQDLHTITSPIVGTFYRSPSPTAEPFVRAGSAVEADTVVCIIEAMKLMNEIQAETSGVIEKIYVENAQPVEYGQPLFGVRK